MRSRTCTRSVGRPGRRRAERAGRGRARASSGRAAHAAGVRRRPQPAAARASPEFFASLRERFGLGAPTAPDGDRPPARARAATIVEAAAPRAAGARARAGDGCVAPVGSRARHGGLRHDIVRARKGSRSGASRRRARLSQERERRRVVAAQAVRSARAATRVGDARKSSGSAAREASRARSRRAREAAARSLSARASCDREPARRRARQRSSRQDRGSKRRGEGASTSSVVAGGPPRPQAPRAQRGKRAASSGRRRPRRSGAHGAPTAARAASEAGLEAKNVAELREALRQEPDPAARPDDAHARAHRGGAERGGRARAR